MHIISAHPPKNVPYLHLLFFNLHLCKNQDHSQKLQEEAMLDDHHLHHAAMEYSHLEEAEAYSSNTFQSSSSSSGRKRKGNKIQRRFSDDQIRSLESLFETESRLEPRKKVQLARELGLQPRQVAIWFQNKRARWKSKQIERDYSILRANYTNMASRFESLKKEKEALLVQLQKLNDLIQKPNGEANEVYNTEIRPANSMDSVSENGDNINKVKAEENRSSTTMERSEQMLGVISDDDDSSIKAEYFGGLQDEPNTLLNFADQVDDSLNFESDELLDQSDAGYQWWDFWS